MRRRKTSHKIFRQILDQILYLISILSFAASSRGEWRVTCAKISKRKKT